MSKGGFNLDPEYFSAFARILPEPTILISHQGKIFGANPAFIRKFSVDQDKLPGINISDLAVTSSEKISKYLQNCSRSRQLVVGSMEMCEDDGKNHVYRCEGGVVRPADGKLPALIYLRFKPRELADSNFIILKKKIGDLNREIIERKRAEEITRKFYREAKEANRLKDEFLATVSHELRTPLNAISGWARMLKIKERDNASFDRAIETIERNVKIQTRLVDDLLDVSRIVTGKLRLEVEPVEIASLIEQSVDSLLPTADNKGIELGYSVDPLIGQIFGDSQRLQQSIWNLLANAIKFTPPDGHVAVSVNRTGAYINISVSDNGVGIEPEFLPYVFDRFRQSDGGKSRQYGGLGLGLSVTRHLIEQHGGTVHGESEGAGKGSTFTITLPFIRSPKTGDSIPRPSVLPAESAMQDTQIHDTKHLLSHWRILVVDQERSIGERVHFELKSQGAKVSLAHSLDKAIEKLEKKSFDILICDTEMPEENGESLIKRIRENLDTAYNDIGAIGLFDQDEIRGRLLSFDSGYDFHIAKPFETGELVATIIALGASRRNSRPDHDD